MDGVATAAGITRRAVYLHFPSRAELVVAVYRHQVDACVDLGERLLRDGSPPFAALREWVDAFVDFLATKHGLATVRTQDESGNLHDYFLDRLDRTYEMHHLWTGQEFGDRLPSDVFREHFLTCFIADPVGIKLRDMIGIDNIAWECDYPHSDSSWPFAAEELEGVTAGVPDAEMNKITYENAMRWYSYDPFAARSKADSTVAALRAESSDHDVQIRPFDKGRFQRKAKGIEIGKLAPKATA